MTLPSRSTCRRHRTADGTLQPTTTSADQVANAPVPSRYCDEGISTVDNVGVRIAIGSSSRWMHTSIPPECTSRSGPTALVDMAEHSMCQPGRPVPQGESQHAISSREERFQSAKSDDRPGALKLAGCNLPYSSPAKRALRPACGSTCTGGRTFSRMELLAIKHDITDVVNIREPIPLDAVNEPNNLVHVFRYTHEPICIGSGQPLHAIDETDDTCRLYIQRRHGSKELVLIFARDLPSNQHRLASVHPMIDSHRRLL